MSDTSLTPKQIAELAATDVLNQNDLDREAGSAIEDLGWQLGETITYESGLRALVTKAIELDRAQRADVPAPATTIVTDERDIEVGV